MAYFRTLVWMALDHSLEMLVVFISSCPLMKRRRLRQLPLTEFISVKKRRIEHVVPAAAEPLLLPLDFLRTELASYLGRVPRSWAIRALARLMSTCKALAESPWHQHVHQLGGGVTGRLSDNDLLRFAPYLDVFIYTIPCHHCRGISTDAFMACTRLRVFKVYSDECYPSLKFKSLPPTLQHIVIDRVPGYDCYWNPTMFRAHEGAGPLRVDLFNWSEYTLSGTTVETVKQLLSRGCTVYQWPKDAPDTDIQACKEEDEQEIIDREVRYLQQEEEKARQTKRFLTYFKT